MNFGDTVTAGNNVTIAYSNSGTNTGTTNGSSVATCQEEPFLVSGIFTASDNLTLTAENVGGKNRLR